MNLPTEPRSGDKFPSANWFAQVISYIKSITPRPSSSIMVSRTPGGTTFEVIGKKDYESYHPWKICPCGNLRVNVIYGQINTGGIKVKLTDADTGALKALDASPAPQLAIPGAAGTYEIYLEGTTTAATSSNFISSGLQVFAALTMPADSTTVFHYSLGTVTVASVDEVLTIVSVAQGPRDNIGYEKGCYQSHYFWKAA